MPDVGSYWFDRHGGPEVVRVVDNTADDGNTFIVLVLNTLFAASASDGRLILVDALEFEDEYQEVPAISTDWTEPGSVWFLRTDAAQLVEIDDSDGDAVSFRILGVSGRRARMPRLEFTELHVRLWEEDVPDARPGRYWVVGSGVNAPFITRADAQAYIFDVAMLLGVPESGFQIVVRGAAPTLQRIVNIDPVAHPMRISFGSPVPLAALRPRQPDPPEAAPLQQPTLWDRLSEEES